MKKLHYVHPDCNRASITGIFTADHASLPRKTKNRLGWQTNADFSGTGPASHAPDPFTTLPCPLSLHPLRVPIQLAEG